MIILKFGKFKILCRFVMFLFQIFKTLFFKLMLLYFILILIKWINILNSYKQQTLQQQQISLMQLASKFYDTAHFLKHRQKTMYFRQFIYGITDFPVGRGHCIISSKCKDQFCFTFIKDQQLEASPAAQVMKGVKLICKNCSAELNKDNLICDISLRALFQRNFGIQQLNQISRVTITPNLAIEAQVEEKWQQLKTNVNNKRLQKLMQYQDVLKTSSKFLLNIDVKNIYQQLSKTNKIIKQELSHFQLSQASLSKSSAKSIVEFCIYEAHLQPKIIHLVGNTAVAYKMVDIKYENRNKADCTMLGFDKKTKNIFYFDGDSRSKHFHYTNIIKHANRDRKALRTFKIGTYYTEGQQHIITSGNIHVLNNIIYIVGGRANAKPIKEIYICNGSQYALDRDQEATVNFKLYATMSKPRLYSGTDMIYIDGQPNLIVYGGTVQQGSSWDTLNDIDIIELHPQRPKNKNLVKTIKSNLPPLALPTIASFQSNKIIIFGGHESVMNDFKQKQNKSFIVAKIDYNMLKCDEISRTVITNYKGLKFGQYGGASSTQKQIVFLRKQDQQEFSKLTVTCVYDSYSGLYQTIRL